MIEDADKSIIRNKEEMSKGDAIHNYTWKLEAQKNESVKKAYELALRLLLDTPENVTKEINRRNEFNKSLRVQHYDKSGKTINR